MRESLKLAETLCARLSHDLSGPIGSALNAMGIALSAAETSNEALQLAADASTEAQKRLKLLVAAFAGDIGDTATTRKLENLLSILPNWRRVRVDFSSVDADITIPFTSSRLILNAALLAAEALPFGGVVLLSGCPTEAITVTIQGPKARWPTALALALSDPMNYVQRDPDIRTLSTFILTSLARQYDAKLQLCPAAGQMSSETPPVLEINMSYHG